MLYNIFGNILVHVYYFLLKYPDLKTKERKCAEMAIVKTTATSTKTIMPGYENNINVIHKKHDIH